MKLSNILLRFTLALFAMASLTGACSVSTTGLGPATDAGATAGASGTAVCPKGLTDRANWPAGTTYTSCTKPCGPDDSGFRSCTQSDKATCQAAGGCVCLEGTPCVACANCAFPTISNCYVPTNATTAPACAKDVQEGGACGPACGQLLCLQADGKTGCVCNSKGKYACATWSETTWK